MDKKTIYLGGPYSHPDENIRKKRYNAYRKLAMLILDKHESLVFSPITHSHPIVTVKNFPEKLWSYDIWLTFDVKMLDVCDELWIAELDGWQESKGTAIEIEHAKATGKPIKMITKRGRVYDYKGY